MTKSSATFASLIVIVIMATVAVSGCRAKQPYDYHDSINFE